MTSPEPHRCTVQTRADGAPFLAFEPTSGAVSPCSNSLFTLDLRPDVSVAEARALADEINQRLLGVSTTIF